MTNRLLAVALAVCASPALAQEDLLACLHPDVRHGLLFRSSESETLLSRTIPDGMPQLDEPGTLEFIGSSVSPFLTVSVYKTALAPIEGTRAAAETLREADWVESYLGAFPKRGFVTGEQPQVKAFCRDGSRLSVEGRLYNDTTYVRLRLYQNRDGLSCEASESGLNGLIARRLGGPNLHEHMPTIELPPEAKPVHGGAVLGASLAGISSNDRSARTEVELQTGLSALKLAEEFGRQLETQGWGHDAAWSGKFSSGSSWTRSPTEEMNLTGLLDIVALGGSGFRASFRLSAWDREKLANDNDFSPDPDG